MRKLFVTALALTGCLSLAIAQNPVNSSGTVQQTYRYEEDIQRRSSAESGGIELTTLGGWQFNGRARGYRNDFKMINSANYGGALAYRVAPLMLAELSVSLSNTTGEVRGIDASDHPKYDMGINYFQLGGIREVTDGKVVPFGMMSLGVTWFDMKNHGAEDHVSFSGALGGGLKLWLSDHVGIRLQGRLLLPMYFSGGGLFLGIGTGGPSAGLGVSTGVIAVQGDFSGGLCFRF